MWVEPKVVRMAVRLVEMKAEKWVVMWVATMVEWME